MEIGVSHLQRLPARLNSFTALTDGLTCSAPMALGRKSPRKNPSCNKTDGIKGC